MPKKSEKTEQFELPNMPEPILPEESKLDRATRLNTRNEKGLLPEIDYILTTDGKKIDWRRMVDPKYIVPWKEKFGQDVNTKDLDVTELPDDKVLILLNGFKKLLKLRGAESVKYTIGQTHEGFASVTCDISWLPNFENREKTSSGCADAHYHNTNSFAKYYCSSIASNRALVRAIRDQLEIEVLGFDEIGEVPTQESTNSNIEPKGSSPNDHLEFVAASAGHTFEKVKNHYLKVEPDSNKKDLATKWESYKDIPPLICLEISAKIEKAEANKKR